jgi:hypothetical protein
MPDKVVNRVIKLGQRAKQQRLSSRLQFLNRHKERFGWDLDEEQPTGLVDRTPRETDALPAEIPGVFVESDFVENNIIEQLPELTNDEQAAAALANANLDSPDTPDELAGVDFDDSAPVMISDDEGDDEDDESIQPKVEIEEAPMEMAVAEEEGEPREMQREKPPTENRTRNLWRQCRLLDVLAEEENPSQLLP